MDTAEKNSLKKLSVFENNVSKAEANLAKAKKEDQAAAKEYERLTTSHKGERSTIHSYHLFAMAL
jgi:hypothetical protein